MALLNQDYDTSKIETKDIGLTIEQMRLVAYNHRRIHERRWYDNNFFDDGFHFRYLSRSTNKIVDLSERATVYTPQRAIPKASRQIRGIANLLLSSDPTPTVYPEDVPQNSYTNPQEKEAVKQRANDIAKQRGWWLEEQWNEPDASGETILQKIALMPILTGKHSISYMQVWGDPTYEKIRTQVFDAFDLYVIGSYTNLEDLPFIIKATPLSIAQIKANPYFDQTQLLKITPDNRQASSEIKEAYMHARYGRDTSSDQAATLILKEAFLKEYLNEENMARIRTQEDGAAILKSRKEGDCIIRQVFVAGGIWLYDTYLNMDTYPFVEFRMEPGPLYQVPLIERFMNANKSLDSAVSRLERYFHTMVTGIWMKRRGEQFKLSNLSGGQVIEYDQAPPVQANLASPGEWTFQFINLLTSFIEEQGVSTSTLGKLPPGVHANAAIESLKQAEYANLVISTRRLKETVRALATKMFAIADNHYLHPQSVAHSDHKGTEYFQVIGDSAAKKRKSNNIDTQDTLVTLPADVKIDIEIEAGMAYTKEGQKATMQTLIDTLFKYSQEGLINPEAVKVAVEKYLEVYQFGSTAEFMEAQEKGANPSLTDKQQQQMQIAVLTALKDAGEVGQEASQRRVMENKVGTLAALKESGLAAKITETVPDNPELDAIPYKDAPEDIKRQMEERAGLTPSQGVSPVAADQLLKVKQLEHTQGQATVQNDLSQRQLDQQAKMQQMKGGKKNGKS